MPFGGPYLPQTTIDFIEQWISDGAPQATAAASSDPRVAHEQPQRAALMVTATMPADGAA